MILWAIGDLHLACPQNRRGLEALPAMPEDWLILVGDVGETQSQLSFALSHLCPRFAKVLWVPGNHDLWAVPEQGGRLQGLAKYQRLVEICRCYGVSTPEDPYPVWPRRGPAGERYKIAPLFLLYDYSLRPGHITHEQAVDWAAEIGLRCADEDILLPEPFPSREAWCQDRLQYTAKRLQETVAEGYKTILVNHFPLLLDPFTASRIDRFSIWCGTRLTCNWHQRFHAAAVVYGHLHLRRSTIIDEVRFEEVSLGYPAQWQETRGLRAYLRKILPLA